MFGGWNENFTGVVSAATAVRICTCSLYPVFANLGYKIHLWMDITTRGFGGGGPWLSGLSRDNGVVYHYPRRMIQASLRRGTG